MTNTRQLKSRNQREGWYAGRIQTETGNRHMRCYLPKNLEGRGREMMGWAAEFKRTAS